MKVSILKAAVAALEAEFNPEIIQKKMVVKARKGGMPFQHPASTFLILHSHLWAKAADDNPDNGALTYEVGITATVTQRIDNVPKDRHDLLISQDTDSIDSIIQRCTETLHQSYTVMAAATTNLAGVGTWNSPLSFADGDPDFEYVDPEWFGNDPKNSSDEIAGIRQSVRLEGARYNLIRRCGDNTNSWD